MEQFWARYIVQWNKANPPGVQVYLILPPSVIQQVQKTRVPTFHPQTIKCGTLYKPQHTTVIYYNKMIHSNTSYPDARNMGMPVHQAQHCYEKMAVQSRITWLYNLDYLDYVIPISFHQEWRCTVDCRENGHKPPPQTHIGVYAWCIQELQPCMVSNYTYTCTRVCTQVDVGSWYYRQG